jgi:hypothetical protein
MNIFVVDSNPRVAAQQLPDKHVVKMPLETCQMVSIIFSNWYWNWGKIHKIDGTPYSTEKGAFRNHPCTVWAASDVVNFAWLLTHGFELCDEYTYRYEKKHSCQNTLEEAMTIFHDESQIPISDYQNVKEFTRAMPDDLKNNTDIDTITAYRKYVASKPWVKDNYLRKPERTPDWMINYA